MKHKKFYLVWCESGNVPTKKHDDHESACREAERLAISSRHHTFHVLECVSSVTHTSVVWTGEKPAPF